MKSKIWRTIYRSYQNLGRDLPRAFRDVEQFNWLAAQSYRPELYDGRVTLFWASQDLRAKFDMIEGWQALARDGMELHEIPGTHLDMIKEPHVGELARVLNDCLLKAQKNANVTEPRANQGPRADRPRGVVVATGSEMQLKL